MGVKCCTGSKNKIYSSSKVTKTKQINSNSDDQVGSFPVSRYYQNLVFSTSNVLVNAKDGYNSFFLVYLCQFGRNILRVRMYLHRYLLKVTRQPYDCY